MEFVNKGETVKVRQNDGVGRFKWVTIKTGETIDLPLEVGENYGFSKVKNQIVTTEGKLGEKRVETKQIEKSKKKVYREKLGSIKGIGKKTVDDIVKIYPEESDLKNAIANKEQMPFRDDVEKLLKKFK